jgi:hypothetical protein
MHMESLKMSLTESEREKLKALCEKFGLESSIINNELSYRQNLSIIIKAIVNKWAALQRDAKAYTEEFSHFLEKEFGKVLVPKWLVSVGDRFREVLKIAENVISKAESIRAQSEKEWEEIKQLPETRPVDIEMKSVKIKSNKRMDEIEEAYLEYAKHLLDDCEWLVKMLKVEE